MVGYSRQHFLSPRPLSPKHPLPSYLKWILFLSQTPSPPKALQMNPHSLFSTTTITLHVSPSQWSLSYFFLILHYKFNVLFPTPPTRFIRYYPNTVKFHFPPLFLSSPRHLFFINQIYLFKQLSLTHSLLDTELDLV